MTKVEIPSQIRQGKDGPKCHGGHCAICGAEMVLHTSESNRGVCNACVKKDKTGRWS